MNTNSAERAVRVVATFPELFRLLASDIGRAVLFALGQGSATVAQLSESLAAPQDAVQRDLDRLEESGLVVADQTTYPCKYLLSDDVQVDLSRGSELSVKVGTHGRFTLSMNEPPSE